MPFKVAGVAGSVSDPAVQAARRRICDLGYLRQPYQRPDGTVGYRCPGEPVDDYVRKGGNAADTVGRMCLCNGLMAAIGLGQTLPGGSTEPPLVTAGSDARDLATLAGTGADTYTAADVLAVISS